MKKIILLISVLGIACGAMLYLDGLKGERYCYTGAFIADVPGTSQIKAFKENYGKKPFFVLTFLDWGRTPDKKVVKDVYSTGSCLMATWEPWNAQEKKGIDFDEILAGKHDAYIETFAQAVKDIDGPVFVRFAHEMNGNWYPWAGTKVGKSKFIEVCKYMHGKFEKMGAKNVRWVFAINSEDIPKDNNEFETYYPGDEYVDYIGIDGYNWGDTKSWSSWTGFQDIFGGAYERIKKMSGKPVMITEFSSAQGGKKAQWISEAMRSIKKMERVKAFIVFNVDKEADWSFPPGDLEGKALKSAIEDGYFLEDIAVKGTL